MQAAAVAAAAPGRFALGIGTSSETIVAGWNDGRFERPLARTRDTLRFLRAALAGERIDQQYETFAVHGFSLERPPEVPPPLLVAALREGMLELAGREADGVCLGMLSARDVARVVPIAQRAGRPLEIFLRVAVVVGRDPERARRAARRLIGPYLAAGPYARFHEWLGNGDAIARIRAAFAAGDREALDAAIPDALVDGIVIHGEPEACRAGLRAFLAAGVTTLCIDVVGSDAPWLEAQQAVIPLP
jgi:probable F420-dependent oxidoreductase